MRAVLALVLLSLAACGGGDGDGHDARPDGDAGAPADASPDVRGPDAQPDGGPDASACASGEDYAALEEHSCFHREHGPRRTVTAGSAGSAPVDVSFSHTEVTVVLPDAGGGSYAGVVRYTASKSRPYVVYADVDPKLTITRAGGAAMAPVCSGGAIGKCAGLAHVTKLSLTKDEAYDFAIGPLETSPVVLVIEEVDFEGP